MRYATLRMALAVWAAVCMTATAQETVVVCQGDACAAARPLYPGARVVEGPTALEDVIAEARLVSIDRIIVTRGTWEAATLNGLRGPLRIEAFVEDKPWDVIIAGAGGGALEVINEHVVIEGVTLTGSGGALKVQGGALVDVNRVLFQNVGSGPVIDVQNGKLLLVNSVARGSGAPFLRAQAGTEVRAFFNTWRDNAGPIIEAAADATVSVTNSIFHNTTPETDIFGGAGMVTGTHNRFWPGPGDPLPTPDAGSDVAQAFFDASSPDPARLDFAAVIVVDDSPFIDKAVEAPVTGFADPGGAYLRSDFGGGARRVPWPITTNRVSLYDIGADEVSFFGGDLQPCLLDMEWSHNPIGKLPARALTINLWFVNAPVLHNPGTPGYNAGAKAVLVPERPRAQGLFNGADPATLRYAIPLEVTHASGDFISLTNPNPIETQLPGTNEFADGLAELWIMSGAGARMEFCLWSDLVLRDLEAVIDTTPPRLVFPQAAAEWRDNAGGNDTLMVPGSTYLPSARHVTVPLPTLPDGVQQKEKAIPAGGGSMSRPPNGVGPHLFFNTGAVVTPTAAPTPLHFGVTATFEDRGPEGAETVMVSGFNPALTGTVTGPASRILRNDGPVADRLPQPPLWLFDAGYGSAIRADDAFRATFTATDDDGDWAGSYEVLGATWESVDETGTPSIPWERVGNAAGNMAGPFANAWHVAVRFSAEDVAGNRTEQDVLLDPLHLWWFITTGATLQPGNDQRFAPESLVFSWQLQRALEPEDAAKRDVPPLFAFRLYENVSAPQSRAGRYEPVAWREGGSGPAGWSAWRAWTGASPNYFLDQGIVENYSGRWLMLVVLGIDEAGNVQPWPFAGDPNGLVLYDHDGGPSWVRFYIEPSETAVTLGLNATFWWDDVLEERAGRQWNEDVGRPNMQRESVFPNATVVPMEPDPLNRQLMALFNLDVTGGVDGIDDYLVWELEEAGVPRPAPVKGRIALSEDGGTVIGDLSRELHVRVPLIRMDPAVHYMPEWQMLDAADLDPADYEDFFALGDRTAYLLRLQQGLYPGTERVISTVDDANTILRATWDILYPRRVQDAPVLTEFGYLDRNGDGKLTTEDLVDAVQYVFRARVILNDNATGAEVRVVSPWRNYYFTVVREAGRFLEPRGSADEQVYKIFER